LAAGALLCIVNVRAGSGLCLDDGSGPPAPHTCDPGSPSFNLPFCDYTLPLDARIADLLSRLNQTRKVALFSQPNPCVVWARYC
jgi:hypothetical protein